MIVPENERQLSLLKSLLQEMKIRYKSENSTIEKYSEELNIKIKQARKEKENGELITIDPNNIWENI